MLQKINVVNLCDAPEHLETVAQWMWEQWSSKKGAKLADIIYRTRHTLFRDRVPQTLVAVSGGECVGTVSLWNNDLVARQDLSPWLAALYVKPECRGRGLGTMLQQKCIEAARSLGYDHLYLITEHIDYYERSGWRFIETAPLPNGQPTRVYVYDIH